jgi:hypothetical protein
MSTRPAIVFISCGQATSEERQTAGQVKQWLESQGFQAFVALETQSLNDINSGTIGRLRDADYYLLIDFPRERLEEECGHSTRARGSLFTHQELAIAYVLDFPEAIFLKHEDVELKGLAQFQMANAATFASMSEVLPLVQNHVRARQWSPDYTRHLRVGKWRWSDGLIRYGDHTGTMDQWVLFVDIENPRNDLAALSTTARLKAVTFATGNTVTAPDQSDLKWAGQAGYQRTIWPGGLGSLDALALKHDHPSHVYLHSALDVARTPVIEDAGKCTLTYQVFAPGFRTLEFSICLELTNTYPPQVTIQ